MKFEELAVDTIIELEDESSWLVFEKGSAIELRAHCVDCCETISAADKFKIISVPIEQLREIVFAPSTGDGTDAIDVLVDLIGASS